MGGRQANPLIPLNLVSDQALKLSEIDNVEVIHAAASDSIGTAEIQVIDGYRVDNTDTSRLEKVLLITVDNIIEDYTVDELSVIKIDTDGFEMGVLLGAKRTIQNYRPSIVFEYGPDQLRNHSGVEPQELIDFLKGFGYEIFYENFEPFDPRGLRLGVDETINLVALHKDKPLTPVG